MPRPVPRKPGSVDGRLAMLRAIRDGRTPEKIKDNLQKLAGRFERIRMTEYEG